METEGQQLGRLQLVSLCKSRGPNTKLVRMGDGRLAAGLGLTFGSGRADSKPVAH